MRSLLFVPADSPQKLQKAAMSGADALILDLESAIRPHRKNEARQRCADFLIEHHARTPALRLYVRINPLYDEESEKDLDAIIACAPHGIMLPKACGGGDLMLLSARIATREAEAHLANGAVRILAQVAQSAAALFEMGSYRGASQRLEGLALSPPNPPAPLARELTRLGAMAADVMAIDGIFTAYQDLDGLRRESQAASMDGFCAKLAIHPAQIPIINAAFTPSPHAITQAHKIVDAFAQNPDIGVLGIDGQMYDTAHLEQAHRLLSGVEKQE